MNETLNRYESSKSNGGEVVVNPIETPRQIVLTGTIAEGKTHLYLDDACGMSASKLSTAAATGTEFALSGQITVANLKSFLLTHAIVVSRFNLDSSVPSDLSNNLELITTKLDGTSKNDFIFSSLDVSNMQNNTDLLNITKGFLLTAVTALKLAGTEDTIYTLTLAIKAVVPYGQLDQYLAANPLVKTC